jgi:signal transduction histidine kinase/CheY-like chemotaxis protein
MKRAFDTCRRIRLAIRMHHLLFIIFTAVAAGPIAILATWEGRASYSHELASVRERHLLLARNLVATMTQYVHDAKSAFMVVFESNAINTPVAGLTDLLTSLNFIHTCIVAPDGTVESWLPGLAPPSYPRVEAKLLGELKELAASGNGRPVLSDLQHSPSGRPIFYLVVGLPERRLGLGVLSTDHLVSLQRGVAFGDHGHVTITDAKGQVIAHPLEDWVATSRDISGVPVVAAMMQGKTGVGQFYSPAFKGDMIAGFSVVPETGWGVMVPQPVNELRRRADQFASKAIIIAVVTFAMAALASWLIAYYLSRPLRQIAQTAEAVLHGNENVGAPDLSHQVPLEVRQLGLAFNTMLTDLRNRNKEISLALKQAQTASLAKTQFLANMSHEIRTPLNGVVGMIELLRLSEVSSTQQRYIQDAMQSSQTLLRLIDDVLDLSKIEAGKLELERAPFDLPSLVERARGMFSEQAKSKGLTLTTSLPAELNVVLLGDPHRLLQILTNLVGNAVKFTSRGGIVISVACLEGQGAALRLKFTVTDTGMGVAPSKQTAIFDAFGQADSSTTRAYGGTGLGLSIARELCHAMSGEIGVDSEIGKGSTFWFTATLDKQEALAASIASVATLAQRKPPTPEASAGRQEFQEALCRAGRSTIHVLLVEDSRANLQITKALLEAIGCNVTTVSSGPEALTAFQSAKFDLILMDCQMPGMDGYETTRKIRDLEVGPRTPIVALTADALDGSRVLSLAAGMDDRLTKPFTLSALTAKLTCIAGGGLGGKGVRPEAADDRQDRSTS